MKTKELCTYLNNYTFCVLVPVYYENEARPAWRKYFIGTKDEAREAYKAAPDYLNATPEENAKNRKNKMQEYIFLMDIGNKKEAEAIKEQYHF